MKVMDDTSPEAVAMRAYRETGDITWLSQEQMTEVFEEAVQKNLELPEDQALPLPAAE